MDMRVLLAEDENITRHLVKTSLQRWGYEVDAVGDGIDAWNMLNGENGPQLAILDWMMPGQDGLEVCRRVRELSNGKYIYIVLLTAKDHQDDITLGLEAGADDYVTKPFDPGELRARVKVGERMIQLHNQLADHVRKLEEALFKVKQLQGLLPICAYCKKIRDDKNYWMQVESYVSEHSEARFSHSICPECYETHVKPELDSVQEPSAPRERNS